MKVKLISVVLVCLFVLLLIGCDKKSPNSPENNKNEISVTNIRDITHYLNTDSFYWTYDIRNNTNFQIVQCKLNFELMCGDKKYNVYEWQNYLEPKTTKEAYGTWHGISASDLNKTLTMKFISYEITKWGN